MSTSTTTSGWTRPRRFDRDLVVIGAGAAGLSSAYIGNTMRAKVTLIEKDRMGGDCLNYGCVPSKALIRSAKLLADLRRSDELGVAADLPDVDLARLMDRVQRIVRAIEPHDSAERYTRLGVECIEGEARITSPWTVDVNGRTLITRGIIIAAGAGPLVPRIDGIDAVEPLTSETVWSLRTLPRRLLVLGGGPIGTELAQCFARLGSAVTQVEMGPRILPREDDDVSASIAELLGEEGVDVLTGHRATAFRRDGDRKWLVAEREDDEVSIEFDEVLIAVGRAPRTGGYGLEELGIPVTERRTVEVDRHLQTRHASVYACGDVAGPYQFTHTAAHEAWYATVNALARPFWRFPIDYSLVPWCTFTDPEVARVGLNERDASAGSVPFEVTRFGLRNLDRAITDEAARGVVKVLTVPGKDRILGVTIVGERAGDMLAEYVLAMKHGIGLDKILKTIHVYPTMSEGNRYAAAKWKNAHAPQRLLGWVERLHAWRRGEAGFPWRG